MRQLYENENTVFEIENGLFTITAKPNTFLNKHFAQLLTNVRLGMQQERTMPVLYDMEGFTDSDKRGRDFLARHIAVMAPAIAICASRHVPKTIAGFILSISKTTVPLGLFANKHAAAAFLRQHH